MILDGISDVCTLGLQKIRILICGFSELMWVWFSSRAESLVEDSKDENNYSSAWSQVDNFNRKSIHRLSLSTSKL